MLKILPVGGISEIGMNQYIFSYKDSFVLIDSGIGFPRDPYLGIDTVISDSKKLFQEFPKISKLFVSHAHEDHIGAIPFLLEQKNLEIIAPPYAVKLIEHKCNRYFNNNKKIKITESVINKEYREGDFLLEYIWTNHSIPDTASIFLQTPEQNILFSSDFKLNGPVDYLKNINLLIKKYGPIDIVFSDSTNAMEQGSSTKDEDVEDGIDSIFKSADKKIVVTLFSSHIDRINMIIRLCKKYKKKLFLSGFNLSVHTDIARSLGYLEKNDQIMDNSEYKNTLKEDIVLLCTGSQGEENSSIVKLAKDYHPFASIEPGDTIIFSSSTIPGNEREILDTVNCFADKGAEIYNDDKSVVHTTGHACSEELKEFINFVKPKYYIPIHGEAMHLKANTRIARACGIDKRDCILLKKDNFLVFNNNAYSFEKTSPIDKLFIDKTTGLVLGKDIVKERKRSAKNGLLIINIVKKSKSYIKAEILSYGVIRIKEIDKIYKKLEEKIMKICVIKQEQGKLIDKVKNVTKQEFRYYFKDKPEVIVNIIKI